LDMHMYVAFYITFELLR